MKNSMHKDKKNKKRPDSILIDYINWFCQISDNKL